VFLEVVFTIASLVEHGDIDSPLRFERLMERGSGMSSHRRQHRGHCST
jgi:hypothetical protein